MSTYYVHLVAFCPPFSAGQLMLITNGRPVFCCCFPFGNPSVSLDLQLASPVRPVLFICLFLSLSFVCNIFWFPDLFFFFLCRVSYFSLCFNEQLRHSSCGPVCFITCTRGRVPLSPPRYTYTQAYSSTPSLPSRRRRRSGELPFFIFFNVSIVPTRVYVNHLFFLCVCLCDFPHKKCWERK